MEKRRRWIELADNVNVLRLRARVNKLISVFLCVYLLIGDKLLHNIVKVAVEPRAAKFSPILIGSN